MLLVLPSNGGIISPALGIRAEGTKGLDYANSEHGSPSSILKQRAEGSTVTLLNHFFPRQKRICFSLQTLFRSKNSN